MKPLLFFICFSKNIKCSINNTNNIVNTMHLNKLEKIPYNSTSFTNLKSQNYSENHNTILNLIADAEIKFNRYENSSRDYFSEFPTRLKRKIRQKRNYLKNRSKFNFDPCEFFKSLENKENTIDVNIKEKEFAIDSLLCNAFTKMHEDDEHVDLLESNRFAGIEKFFNDDMFSELRTNTKNYIRNILKIDLLQHNEGFENLENINVFYDCTNLGSFGYIISDNSNLFSKKLTKIKRFDLKTKDPIVFFAPSEPPMKDERKDITDLRDLEEYVNEKNKNEAEYYPFHYVNDSDGENGWHYCFVKQASSDIYNEIQRFVYKCKKNQSILNQHCNQLKPSISQYIISEITIGNFFDRKRILKESEKKRAN